METFSQLIFPSLRSSLCQADIILSSTGEVRVVVNAHMSANVSERGCVCQGVGGRPDRILGILTHASRTSAEGDSHETG